jgi:hypothetical protein
MGLFNDRYSEAHGFGNLYAQQSPSSRSFLGLSKVRNHSEMRLMGLKIGVLKGCEIHVRLAESGLRSLYLVDCDCTGTWHRTQLDHLPRIITDETGRSAAIPITRTILANPCPAQTRAMLQFDKARRAPLLPIPARLQNLLLALFHSTRSLDRLPCRLSRQP